MPFASNNNAVLIDSCKNLQNLSVLLEVGEDIATTGGNGWSLQLNCYPPAGEHCQTSQVNWFQYMVVVQGGNLAYYIQYWAAGCLVGRPATNRSQGRRRGCPAGPMTSGTIPRSQASTATRCRVNHDSRSRSEPTTPVASPVLRLPTPTRTATTTKPCTSCLPCIRSSLAS